MSQTLAATASRHATARALPSQSSPTAHRGAARPRRPALRVVQAPRTDRGRSALAVASGLLLLSGLLALLLVNTALAQGSYSLHDLQSQSRLLADQEQALNEELAVLSAPDRLAARATSMGLVPSEDPVFLRLPDGRVLGVAEATEDASGSTVKKPAAVPGTDQVADATATARSAADTATTTTSSTLRTATDAVSGAVPSLPAPSTER